MAFDLNRQSIEEDEPTEYDPEASAKRRMYVVVAMFLITVVVVGAFLTILASGAYGGWWQRMTMSHDPVTSAPVGQEIEVKAKITGYPENVTLYYLVTPNNATVETIRQITFKRSYMLLLGERAQDYSYTIPAIEVTGDIVYFIVATDDFGNEIAEPMHEIEVSDFIVRADDRTAEVYYSTPSQIEITVKSLHNFNFPVTLRISQTFGDYIPSGLTAEFNPKTVTPPKNGEAKSTLTIRAVSKDYLPGGDFEMVVEGLYSSPYVSIVRNSTVIDLEVPSFDFTVSPTYQELPRSVISSEYTTGYLGRERYVTYNITLDIEGRFSSDFEFRVVGLPERLDYRIVLPEKRINMSGQITYSLQVMDERYLAGGTITTTTTTSSTYYRSGAYLLTIYVIGGGYERWEQVTLEVTGYGYDQRDYR
ncbi:MAG: hypothetical protein NWF08_02235 [Candidatus Bathyarchaeota archaeon]|nr:hypothetical protein [Candidatus Bathyarchaeota archaeon]